MNGVNGDPGPEGPEGPQGPQGDPGPTPTSDDAQLIIAIQVFG
jgi:hypothetical protein